MHRGSFFNAAWWFANFGQDHYQAFCNMLAFDALVCNTDRHLSNFGLLRDSHTGAALGLAPIFDNGRTLFPNVAEGDAAQFALEAQLRSPAFGGTTFEEQLSRFIGEEQLALFELARKRGIVGNVLAPGRRVSALDAFLRKRAEELVGIPLVDQEELKTHLEAAMAQREPANDGIFRISA